MDYRHVGSNVHSDLVDEVPIETSRRVDVYSGSEVDMYRNVARIPLAALADDTSFALVAESSHQKCDYDPDEQRKPPPVYKSCSQHSDDDTPSRVQSYHRQTDAKNIFSSNEAILSDGNVSYRLKDTPCETDPRSAFEVNREDSGTLSTESARSSRHSSLAVRNIAPARAKREDPKQLSAVDRLAEFESSMTRVRSFGSVRKTRGQQSTVTRTESTPNVETNYTGGPQGETMLRNAGVAMRQARLSRDQPGEQTSASGNFVWSNSQQNLQKDEGGGPILPLKSPTTGKEPLAGESTQKYLADEEYQRLQGLIAQDTQTIQGNPSSRVLRGSDRDREISVTQVRVEDRAAGPPNGQTGPMRSLERARSSPGSSWSRSKEEIDFQRAINNLHSPAKRIGTPDEQQAAHAVAAAKQNINNHVRALQEKDKVRAVNIIDPMSNLDPLLHVQDTPGRRSRRGGRKTSLGTPAGAQNPAKSAAPDPREEALKPKRTSSLGSLLSITGRRRGKKANVLAEASKEESDCNRTDSNAHPTPSDSSAQQTHRRHLSTGSAHPTARSTAGQPRHRRNLSIGSPRLATRESDPTTGSNNTSPSATTAVPTSHGGKPRPLQRGISLGPGIGLSSTRRMVFEHGEGVKMSPPHLLAEYDTSKANGQNLPHEERIRPTFSRLDQHPGERSAAALNIAVDPRFGATMDAEHYLHTSPPGAVHVAPSQKEGKMLANPSSDKFSRYEGGESTNLGTNNSQIYGIRRGN